MVNQKEPPESPLLPSSLQSSVLQSPGDPLRHQRKIVIINLCYCYRIKHSQLLLSSLLQSSLIQAASFKAAPFEAALLPAASLPACSLSVAYSQWPYSKQHPCQQPFLSSLTPAVPFPPASWQKNFIAVSVNSKFTVIFYSRDLSAQNISLPNHGFLPLAS